MLHTFWTAVRSVEPGTVGEQRRVGAAEGDIAEPDGPGSPTCATARSRRARLHRLDDLLAAVHFGVGPAGQHLRTLSPEARAQVRDTCRAALPDGRFRSSPRLVRARTVPR